MGPRFLFDPKMLRAFSLVKVFMNYRKENVNDFSSTLFSWKNNYFLYFEVANSFKGFWYYIPIFRAIAHTQFNDMAPFFVKQVQNERTRINFMVQRKHILHSLYITFPSTTEIFTGYVSFNFLFLAKQRFAIYVT